MADFPEGLDKLMKFTLEGLPLNLTRKYGLNYLATVIIEIWGPRCDRSEGGCATCAAWTLFDSLERMTDASSLDDATTAGAVQEHIRKGEEAVLSSEVFWARVRLIEARLDRVDALCEKHLK